MDLAALSIFLLAFILCSLMVFFISVYGTKEVSFEENLKATHGDAKKAKNQEQAKKKAKKTKVQPEISENEQPKEVEKPVEKVEKPIEKEVFKQPSKEVVKQPPKEVKEPKEAPIQPKRSQTPDEIIEANEVIEAEVELHTNPDVVKVSQTSSSAEVTPKKSKKMKIKEVDSRKSKKKAENELMIQPENSLEDLVGMVLKTPLDDLEIQNVIDLLLTKQTGSSSSGMTWNDWIDSSKNKNETEILQRQLAEKEAMLNDEVAKCKSVTEKMNLLRHELNAARTNQVQHQRYVNDLEAQRKQMEARLHAEMEGHQRFVATLQSQIQYHATRAQNLQVTVDSVQQQQATIDPRVYAELENLRAIKMSLETEKMSLEAECGSLHGRLGKQQEEQQQLQQKLTKNNMALEEAKTSVKKLSDKLNSLEKKNSTESGHFEDLKRLNQDLEGKVKELSSMCMKQKSEMTRLVEDNERISDQLANQVERPAAEGQEANGNSNHNGINNHQQEQENPWHKKYLAISQEHETIVKEKDVILQKMHSAESHYKSQVSKLEADLEDQRAKNNELRSKNWKTVEALKSVEQSYEKLLKSNQNKSDSKVLESGEQSEKLFLQRLFPSVKTAAFKAQKHNEWLEEFAKEATTATTKPAKKANNEGDKLQKLEGQVKHYKAVLAETESMLNQLQASVESEESLWKSKFSEKESHVFDLQRQLEAVEAKNAAMEASLESLNSVEEMETKLRELQEKLAVEEADKLQLQNKLHESLDSEEMNNMREQIQKEVQLRKELDDKLAKMNQLLSTGQEALQQEKKTVEMLRQQLIQPNQKATGAINGQEEPESSASSQVGSVASLADLETSTGSEKKKSKKKKAPSVVE